MKIKMIQNTFTVDLGYLAIGKSYEIKEDIAERWIKNKIAISDAGVINHEVKSKQEDTKGQEIKAEPIIEVEVKKEIVSKEQEDKIDLNKLKKAELVAIAKEIGIEDAEKCNKAELIKLLEE